MSWPDLAHCSSQPDPGNWPVTSHQWTTSSLSQPPLWWWGLRSEDQEIIYLFTGNKALLCQNNRLDVTQLSPPFWVTQKPLNCSSQSSSQSSSRTLILAAWSNKQGDWRLEVAGTVVWPASPGQGDDDGGEVVTITIFSEHSRNLSPLSLPAPRATLLSPDIEFCPHSQDGNLSVHSFGAAEDVWWSVNKQDVDWRRFMMLPFSPVRHWSSPVVRWPLFCGHQSKPRLVTLSSLGWHIVCLKNGPQISERPSQEIICSRG